MASHQQKQLSAGSKIKLNLKLLLIVAETLCIFFTKFVPRLFAKWPIKRTIAVSFLKCMRWLTLEEMRSTNTPTGESIRKYCQTAKLSCKSTTIECEGDTPAATIHSIQTGAHQMPKTLFYLHGGGYINPINAAAQLSFAVECARAAAATNLVVLEYTLAPELKYPGQLVQAVEALRYLLLSHSPSQILIGGDSAGGHLVLSLLAHLKSPSPYTKAIPETTKENLQAVFLISPWVALNYDTPSYKSNASKDYLSARAMRNFTTLWNPTRNEIWAEPLMGDSKFWSEVPVDQVLITTGEWEVFLDDDLEMAARFDAKDFGTGAPVELVVGEKEIHVTCAVDTALGVPHGQTASGILKWLGSRVT